MVRKTLALSFLLCACSIPSHPTEVAEERLKTGDFSGARKILELHMADRLSIANRPDWENPYFYLLRIGDIELEQNNIAAAEKLYLEAEDKGVTPQLVTDRLMNVARIYEDSGELEKAIEFLKKYRNRDSLLMNSMLDRLVRSRAISPEALPTSPAGLGPVGPHEPRLP
jgi:tetratricopeptide (TPR) repeat protein